MITVKTSLTSRVSEAVERVKKAATSSAWITSKAVLAEAQRRVRRGKTLELLDSLEIVGEEGSSHLLVGSRGSHGGRPVAQFIEKGTAHNHAQPFLGPAGNAGRKVLEKEATSKIRSASEESGG